MNDFSITDRNRVRRLPKRAAYDRDTIHAILDDAFLCHVAYVLAEKPYMIPTAYARDGDSLILHGSAASRMLHHLGQGFATCVSVTIVDGLVLARSAFHHSINYRSVVMFGTASLIEELDEKGRALERFMEHLTPGRWSESREPSPKELRGTSVIRFTIDEASAKTRSGDPVDDEEDHSLDLWAGQIPIRQQLLEPVRASGLGASVGMSGAVEKTISKWR